MKTIFALALLCLAVVLPSGGGLVAQDAADPEGKSSVESYRRLLGEEVGILLERTYAALAEQVPAIDALWDQGGAGTRLEEQWNAAATALCDDLTLYLNSSVDAATDWVNEKKVPGTENDVENLRARVRRTLDFAEHAIRKKGLEVMVFRDTTQTWVDALRGYKEKMPAVLTLLEADVGYCMDATIRVERRLDGHYETVGEIEEDLDTMESCRRILRAVKLVTVTRQQLVGKFLQDVHPDKMKAAMEKALENWVPADMLSGTFLLPGTRQTIEAWPVAARESMVDIYQEHYDEAVEAVKPLVEATYTEEILLEGMTWENLGAALDPVIEKLKKAIEERKKDEDEAKEIERELGLIDGEMGKLKGAASKTKDLLKRANDAAAKVYNTLKNETQRSEYRRIGKKYAELEAEIGKVEDMIERLGEAIEEERERISDPKNRTGMYLARMTELRTSRNLLTRQLEGLEADLEELDEQLQKLRAVVAGD